MKKAVNILLVLTIVCGVVSISVTFYKTVIKGDYGIVNLSAMAE